jgi:hypothetical protein
MNLWCDLLDRLPYAKDDVLERLMPGEFQVSAVITNSKEREYLVYRNLSLKKGFSIVFDYQGPNTGKGPIPSRDEHLAEGKKYNVDTNILKTFNSIQLLHQEVPSDIK